MGVRTDADRFALLNQIVERIADEPALREPFGLQIRYDQQSGLSHSSREPARPNLRSLLMEVRKLDAPGEDVFLPALLDIAIARATTPKYRKELARAKRTYDQLQVSGQLQIADSEGAISPRLAFALWAYSEHLHDDAAKGARVARMPPELRALLRQNAIGYMDDLIRIAAYLRMVSRNDPGLQ